MIFKWGWVVYCVLIVCRWWGNSRAAIVYGLDLINEIRLSFVTFPLRGVFHLSSGKQCNRGSTKKEDREWREIQGRSRPLPPPSGRHNARRPYNLHGGCQYVSGCQYPVSPGQHSGPCPAGHWPPFMSWTLRAGACPRAGPLSPATPARLDTQTHPVLLLPPLLAAGNAPTGKLADVGAWVPTTHFPPFS